MSEPLRDFDLKGKAFHGKHRLLNVVPIELDSAMLKSDHDARELTLRPGDRVVVETERGPLLGTVRGHVRRQLVEVGELDRVLRRATEHDAQTAERHAVAEIEAYRFAIERIRTRRLAMKLVRAQWMHDGSRLVFYFSADGRIDFRDLVRDLAHQFRTRIEMHQIGVRDGARMLGGIGPCGRELCCSTFLENFAPVSIRMAKDQGLTLNPTKVSGMCGRLMCCLVYEQQLYRSLRKRVPRAGKKVRTREGVGKVYDVDVINRRVGVELESGERKSFDVVDVVTLGKKSSDDGYVDHGVAPVEYEWDHQPASDDDESDAGKKKKRRRRRRSGKKGGKKGS